jgi:hypothetical protein
MTNRFKGTSPTNWISYAGSTFDEVEPTMLWNGVGIMTLRQDRGTRALYFGDQTGRDGFRFLDAMAWDVAGLDDGARLPRFVWAFRNASDQQVGYRMLQTGANSFGFEAFESDPLLPTGGGQFFYLTNGVFEYGNPYVPVYLKASALYQTVSMRVATNLITSAQAIYIDVSTNGYQFLSLAGHTSIHTTNRTASPGYGRGTTLFMKAPSTNCSITCNSSWVNFGTNTTFTALANKWVSMTFFLTGPAETDVIVTYDNQKN